MAYVKHARALSEGRRHESLLEIGPPWNAPVVEMHPYGLFLALLLVGRATIRWRDEF